MRDGSWRGRGGFACNMTGSRRRMGRAGLGLRRGLGCRCLLLPGWGIIVSGLMGEVSGYIGHTQGSEDSSYWIFDAVMHRLAVV